LTSITSVLVSNEAVWAFLVRSGGRVSFVDTEIKACILYIIKYNIFTPTRAVNRGARLTERATLPEG
jgi:hypothetical protein